MSSGDTSNPGETQPIEPQCADCQYFYITWELNQRYGCRAFGFKSQQLPCRVVLQVDGNPCNSYRSLSAASADADSDEASGLPKSGRIDLKI